MNLKNLFLLNGILLWFRIFNYSLLDIYNYINNNNYSNQNKIVNNINKISVQDCFKYFQRNKNINKVKYFKCINCSNNTNFNFINNLYRSTPYLFISLSYNNVQNQNIKFEISENIDLNNFNTTTKYELYGIVGLLNENDKNGKFIAYCKNDKSIK